MATIIEDGLEGDLAVTSGQDAEGNPKPIDTGVQVTGVSSDPALLEVVGPGPDMASVTFRTVPGPGTGKVSITLTADADANPDGDAPITVVHEFEVTAGATTTLTTEVTGLRPRATP